MKKQIILLIIGFLPLISIAQTKSETYEYIKQKLSVCALQGGETEHAYSVLEVGESPNNEILIVDACNMHPPVASIFSPIDFYSITRLTKSSSIWFTINCKVNSVKIMDEDSDGHFYVSSKTSKIPIILNKDTPQKEIDRLEKAFIHLLKLYGVENKDLFD